MKESQLKALISLLDDSDEEVLVHVEGKILEIGDEIIPLLEKEWEENYNPTVQFRIEQLIHQLQYTNLVDRLNRWVKKPDDLLKGLWILATYQYPDLNIDKLKEELEQLYYDVWVEFNGVENPVDQIKVLNNVFFGKFKFGPNSKNFHAPANSMINAVLESKKGNPISLCSIYLIIAQRLGLPVYGVNLPNLFVLTYKAEKEQFYINVFNKGLIFSRADVDNYLGQIKLEPKEMFYEPCTNKDIVLRALRNLVVSFEKLGDSEKVEEIKMIIEGLN